MSITTRLLRIKDRDGLRAVESALMEIFSPAYCGKLLRATYSRPSFQMWRPTLEKAMRAHRRRDFALAIPIWLMAIDGVAQDELSRPAVFNNLGTRSRQEMAKSLETGGLRDILLDAWLDVMVGIGGNRSGSSSGLVLVVNRHEVLHGRRPRVGGEREQHSMHPRFAPAALLPFPARAPVRRLTGRAMLDLTLWRFGQQLNGPPGVAT